MGEQRTLQHTAGKAHTRNSPARTVKRKLESLKTSPDSACALCLDDDGMAALLANVKCAKRRQEHTLIDAMGMWLCAHDACMARAVTACGLHDAINTHARSWKARGRIAAREPPVGALHWR